MEIRISLGLFRAARKMHKMASPSGRKLRTERLCNPENWARPAVGDRAQPGALAPPCDLLEERDQVLDEVVLGAR